MLGKALDVLESCNSRTRRFKIINKKICHRIDPVSSTYQPHSVLSCYYAVIFLLVPSCFFQGVSLPKFCRYYLVFLYSAHLSLLHLAVLRVGLLSDVCKSPVCLLCFPLTSPEYLLEHFIFI